MLKLVITPEVYETVMYWVKKADFEVSGLGMVEVHDGQAYVTKALLLDQIGAGASTDISPEDINRAQYETRRDPGDLKWWWHSHVNMGVFWSQTDKDTIKQLGDQGWFFHTVFNKKSEKKSAFSSTQTIDCPFYTQRYSYSEEECETEIRSVHAATNRAELDRMFDLKVKQRTFPGAGETYNQETGLWEPGGQRSMGLVPPSSKSDRKHTRKLLTDMASGFSDYNSRSDFECFLEELIAQGVQTDVIQGAFEHDLRRFGVSIGKVKSDYIAAQADARLAHGTVV